MKNIFLTLTIFLIVQQITSAQQFTTSQLDSLFNRMIRIHNPVDNESPSSDSTFYPDNKCAFGLVNTIAANIDLFTPEQQRILKILFDRPQKSDSMITLGGFFIIHYNASGADAPAYDVNELAAALDSSYNFEINYLGYPTPPADNNAGGDNHYDVYISDISAYGFTTFEFTGNATTGPSFITVDNDFGSGFFTHGIEATKVTAAHEFHHSIQAGNYIFRIEDLFFYELTSTSMEEFVFDDVNDYYGYMPSYFNNTSKSLTSFLGYEIAIWNVFLQNNFGFEIIKRQWEWMTQYRAIDAINLSINEKQKSLGEEFKEFGKWTYFTNFRASLKPYFDEAINYPLVKYLSSIVNTPPIDSVTGNSYPLANNYFRFILSSGVDTLSVFISNIDFETAKNSNTSEFPYTYKLFNDSISGERNLTSELSSTFTAENENNWLVVELLNNRIIGEDSLIYNPNLSLDQYAYPNPFYYSKNSSPISIPAPNNISDQVSLNIYTVSMKSVFESILTNLRLSNGNYVQWDGLDTDGNKLPTGVYIYVTKMNDEIVKGKLVIFNE